MMRLNLLFYIFFLMLKAQCNGTIELNEIAKFDQVNVYPDFSNHPVLKSLKRYHITTPHQFEDFHHRRRKRDLATQLATGMHSENAYFLITFEGKEHVLDLSINKELLPQTFSTSSYAEDGKLLFHKSTPKERNHCFYQGKVRGISGSQVIVSTCNGIKGCIILPDDFFIIEPLTSTSVDTNKHVVFRPNDVVQKELKTCGNKDVLGESYTFVKQLNTFAESNGSAHLRERRALGNERKFVELFIVADNSVARIYDAVALDLRIKEIANFMDGFYQKLGIRIVLSHVETWRHVNPISESTNPSVVLNEFLAYRRQQVQSKPANSPWVYADNVQLLYGGNFDGSTIGMAPVGSMCGVRSGGVNQNHSPTAVHVAATFAHEMGHNFGMHHDSTDCSCPGTAHCIMAPAASYGKDRDWSTCSRSYLEQNLELGAKSCLLNVPEPSRIYGGPECGNDIIEEGEECDCGTAEFCQSPCCNATSCKLLPGAVCDSGVCCSDCQYIEAGTVCRDTKGSKCDLAEYCTGHSANCPADVYSEDGSPCNDQTATCYEGICLTHDMQCQSIWGETAKSGAQICYDVVNTKGNINGNCGRNPNGQLIPCHVRNVRCGKLQCETTRRFPLIGSNRISFVNTLTSSDGTVARCRTISSEVNVTDVSDPGLVRTGTLCGTGKICSEGKCVTTPPMTCAKTCNGNGVCNNLKHCHCDSHWAPPYCDTSGTGGSVDSGPIIRNEGDTQAILMIVLLAVVLPIILAPFTFVWYRYCGGKVQIKTWKKNRQDRLAAVARNKAINKGRIVKSSGMSNSHEDLISNNTVTFRPTAGVQGHAPNPVRHHVPAAVHNTPGNTPRRPPPPSRPPPSFTPSKPPHISQPPAYEPPSRPTPSRTAPPVPIAAKSPNPLFPPSLPQQPHSVATPSSGEFAKPSVPARPGNNALHTDVSDSSEPAQFSVMQRAKMFNAV